MSAPEDWIPRSEVLAFAIGGRNLFHLRIPALTLTTPFPRLSTDWQLSLPPWPRLPPGIRAAVVPAQPFDRLPSHIAHPSGWLRYISLSEERHFIQLCGSFDDYARKFSPKSRQTIQRKVRKFAEFSGGSLDFREYRTPAEIESFYPLACAVSQKSYQESIGFGLPSSPTFRRDLMDRAAQGLVRGTLLFHANVPISFGVCQAHGDSLFYAYLGYDPAFRNWSPGTVMFWQLLERLFTERTYTYLDFGDSDFTYKKFFATGSLLCARVLYLHPTPLNWLIAITHLALTQGSLLAGRVLVRLGLKDRIKRLLTGAETGNLDQAGA